MYIDPFVAGALAVILVEFVAIVAYGIYKGRKK